MLLPLLLVASSLGAETHTVQATRYYNSFDHRNAVLARIAPGDAVITKTLDAGGYDQAGKKAGERPNPLTGPFYIAGAEPGDAIAVTFVRMRPNRDYGFTNHRLGVFSLNPEMVEGLYPRAFKRGAVYPDRDDILKWRIDLEKQVVRLEDPVSKVHKMEPWAAHMLIGYQGSYDVVTVAGSMALRIPRTALPK